MFAIYQYYKGENMGIFYFAQEGEEAIYYSKERANNKADAMNAQSAEIGSPWRYKVEEYKK